MAIDSKIRSIIENFGHIKIDDMMREALSANYNSYYKSKELIGNMGDFITSPEISQLFGEVIGFWIISKWQEQGCPEDIALIELGPGMGTLMADLMRVVNLVPKLSQALEVFLLEINKNFIKKQRNTLKNSFNFSEAKLSWISNIDQLPKKPSIIISNEFFDSLPIKQYIKIRQKWYESVVICDPIDGILKYDKIELPKALLEQLNIDHKNAMDGAVMEESVESLYIMRKIAMRLLKFGGAFLAIDYGYDIQPQLRSRRQYNPTLQAVKNHKYHPVMSSLGEADLTAHVDFNALKNSVLQKGVKEVTISSQRDFLIKNGIRARHESLKKSNSVEIAKILDKQLHRLIDKNQMGEIFKAMEYCVIR